MAIFKCKMCGGNIEFEPGATVGVCDSCGTKQTLPKTSDDVVANLFNRANNLRLKCEFDKAEQIYEKIVQQDDSEAEAHWGIVLCKYGIEYVEDPASGKRLPTCHRTLFDAVTADADYQAALDYSDAAQQAIYEAEARAIDRIQRDILSIVKNEKPFDVFICYKETDEAGKRTVDSALANDIYYQLTQEGLKVFYAAITLEDKLGQEYEPYIFAALNSAKVMLVVGTKSEHFNAVWVRNEWSRFLKLMKTDRSKLLIPCYRDMDAYDLPEEFAHLQAQDMGKIGFVNDVVRGIKKVAGGAAPAPASAAEPTAAPTAAPAGSVAPLLERAFLFLEDGEWQKADGLCEQVLNQDPKNAEAYLGKLMAELQVKTRKELTNCDEPFDDRDSYQKALRFGDDDLKTSLTAYVKDIKDRNEQARLEGIYEEALAEMKQEKSAAVFSAKEKFESISGYKDADEQAAACQKKVEELKAEEERKKKIIAVVFSVLCACVVFIVLLPTAIIPSIKYNKAVALMEAGKYEEAYTAFDELAYPEKGIYKDSGYKDSRSKREEAGDEAEYQKAVALMEAGKYEEAIKAFDEFIWNNPENEKYDDEVIYEKIEECQSTLKEINYNAAVSLLNDGKIVDAYKGFVALDGYKDSAVKASKIFSQHETELWKAVETGDSVYFGTYEQDNNKSNGKEDIEWQVLDVKDGKALVVSKYALDCKEYNTEYAEVTWESCSLRKWLKRAFMNDAFSADEQAKIATTNVTADKNPEYDTDPGNATKDKVFLLSIAEVKKYFTTDEARICAPTAYAKALGAYTSDWRETARGEATCEWRLRSPGDYQDDAAYVSCVGSVDYDGVTVVRDNDCVRPAMWITLE